MILLKGPDLDVDLRPSIHNLVLKKKDRNATKVMELPFASQSHIDAFYEQTQVGWGDASAPLSFVPPCFSGVLRRSSQSVRPSSSR